MILPFGKHKGANLSDAPTQYLQWLVNVDWLRDPLRTAIEAELERRESLGRKSIVAIDTDVASRIISSGVRALSKSAHPDAGGDGELMAKINATADAMREMVGC
jgi:hypothetical protein